MIPDSNSKLRLLILTSTYPRWEGDPEPAFVHELAKRLTGQFEVAVLGPHAAGAQDVEKMDGVNVYRYHYAPVRYETLVNDGGIVANLKRALWKWLLVPGFLFAQWMAYRRLVRDWRPDVVHAHWLIPQGLVVALGTYGATLKPLVVTSHGADLFAIRGRLFAWLRKKVIAKSAALTVVSRAMQDRLFQEVSRKNIVRVMPMGVDLSQRFTPAAAVLRSPRQLLFVGRLVEKKGCIFLIEAMPAVIRRFPDIKLTVVGFGPERVQLMNRVEELGIGESVIFSGAVPQSELAILYQSATALIAPFIEAKNGDQEGLGLVVAEAIGCHCPVVVGDVPAVHDVVDSRYCSMVTQSDIEGLSAAIIRVIDDPRRAQLLAVQARREIETRLSWSAVSEGYAELLASVASHVGNKKITSKSNGSYVDRV